MCEGHIIQYLGFLSLSLCLSHFHFPLDVYPDVQNEIHILPLYLCFFYLTEEQCHITSYKSRNYLKSFLRSRWCNTCLSYFFNDFCVYQIPTASLLDGLMGFQYSTINSFLFLSPSIYAVHCCLDYNSKA